MNLTNFATKTEFDRARLHTVDIEAIRSFTPGNWKLDGTFGARQASIFTDAKIDVFGINFLKISRRVFHFASSLVCDGKFVPKSLRFIDA